MTMSAFVPIVPNGSFTAVRAPLACPISSARQQRLRMAVDLDGPPFSKYLSRIPLDRLNKAPIITLNAFSNADFNSVAVRLADLPADQGAGNSLRAGIKIDDEQPPAPSLYSKYYDPATLHEAPIITMYGGATTPSNGPQLCILQTAIPTRLPEARAILGDKDPDPALYEARYGERLNMAPEVNVQFRTSEEDSTVGVENVFQPLPMLAASQILAKYRK